MNDNLLVGFSHLWDGSDPGWVLVSVPDEPGRYSIVHKAGQSLLIESDDLYEAVCKKMLEEGCEILDDLPPIGEATALPI